MPGITDFPSLPSSWQLPELLLEFPCVPETGRSEWERDEILAFLTHLWRGMSLLSGSSLQERSGYTPDRAVVGRLQRPQHIGAQGGTCPSECFSTHLLSLLPLAVGMIKYEDVESRTDRNGRFEPEYLCFCIFLCSSKAWLFSLLRVTLRSSRLCWCSYKPSHFQC